MDNETNDIDYLKNLGPVLDDYARWFGEMTVHIAYPTSNYEPADMPNSFESWNEKALEANTVNFNVLKNLTETYEYMAMEGRAINKLLQDGDKPEQEVFESFKTRYENFFRQIRRLERESAIEESGFDEQTGLRSHKSIEGDMRRELERLERQGTTFCQAMARIDGFPGLSDQNKILSLVAASIKKTIRPFDDAYYLGEGHFLISMKQADIIGAEAGVNRIRLQLKQNDDNKEGATLSFCLMEPVVGDESDKILKNMKQDLSENEYECDLVIKFKEISELERFIGTMN